MHEYLTRCFARCHECGGYVPDDTLVDLDGALYCAVCADALLAALLAYAPTLAAEAPHA